jgi:hypothetical protein
VKGVECERYGFRSSESSAAWERGGVGPSELEGREARRTSELESDAVIRGRESPRSPTADAAAHRPGAVRNRNATTKTVADSPHGLGTRRHHAAHDRAVDLPSGETAIHHRPTRSTRCSPAREPATRLTARVDQTSSSLRFSGQIGDGSTTRASGRSEIRKIERSTSHSGEIERRESGPRCARCPGSRPPSGRCAPWLGGITARRAHRAPGRIRTAPGAAAVDPSKPQAYEIPGGQDGRRPETHPQSPSLRRPSVLAATRAPRICRRSREIQ